MSPTLKSFYQDILKAVEEETKPDWFDPYCGLCTNLNCWYNAKSPYPHLNYLAVDREMVSSFTNAGLDKHTPFNDVLRGLSYTQEQNLGILWENERRLQWVREHAQ